MVEEGRRFHFSNPLPCPQSGFGVFRGCKSIALPIAGQNTSGYTKPPRPNQAHITLPKAARRAATRGAVRL